MATSQTLTQTLLAAVPDGSTVKYADFQKAVGPDHADILNFCNPQTITRNGNHLIMDCAAAATTSNQAVEVTIAKRVELDIDPQSAALSAKNITGVSVKVSVVAMDLKEATLDRDANGDTKVTCKLLASKWLPYVPYSLTIAPDGTVK